MHEEIKTHYQEEIARFQGIFAHPAVERLRKRGVEAFKSMDLPHTRMEAWRQTNVSGLLAVPFTPVSEKENACPPLAMEALFPGVGMKYRMVFMNGCFRPELSRIPEAAGSFFGGLRQALEGAESERVTILLDKSPEPRHAFSALNNAFLQDGPVICLGKDTSLGEAVHVIFLSAGLGSPRMVPVRTLLDLAPGASMKIVYHHLSLQGNGSCFHNHVEECFLAQNAALGRVEVIRDGMQEYRVTVSHIRQDSGSRLESHSVALDGGAVTRNEICAEMNGPDGTCHLFGLAMNQQGHLLDNDLQVKHNAAACASRMVYKHVLDKSSHGVFTGRIYVAQAAQKTDSEQLSANILLSETARMDAKPQLEIYADDVRCTHGVTVGRPDDAELFYLRTRGISKDLGAKMLTRGFAGDMIRRIPDESVGRWLEEEVWKRIQS